MGIFDAYRKFREKRRLAAIESNKKQVINPKAIRDERIAAIDYFCHLDDAEIATNALLGRFEFSLEHGINDTREKEQAMAGIVRFGEKAIPTVEAHIMRSEKIAWPLKCFKAIATEEQLISALKNCLSFGDIAFDQKRVDKNYDILCYLREFKLDYPTCEKIFFFLDQHDERVRFAAVEVLVNQSYDQIPARLEGFIKDASAENTRIRQAVILAFLEHQWPLQQKAEFAVGPVIPGVQITKDYRLSRSH